MNKALIKWTFASLIIAFIFSSCNKKVQDNYRPKHTSEYLSKQLETAYKENDSVRLNAFFEEWQKSVKPNTDEFIHQNKVYTAIYDIYKVFYRPLNLMKYGDYEFGNSLNLNSKYVAIQSRIYYKVINWIDFNDQFMIDLKLDSIDCFRPPVNVYNRQTLYLTDEYSHALYNFLGKETFSDYLPISKERWKDCHRRYRIIRPYLPVAWGMGSATSPLIQWIYLNVIMTKAQVKFNIGYSQAGIADFEKENGIWVMKKSVINEYID
jgi:hypothetical protein